MATVRQEERTFWHKEATQLLRGILWTHRVTYKELSRLLEGFGEFEPEKTLSNKINRGTFSFIFFVKCLYAINRLEGRLELPHLSAEQREEIRKAAGQQRRRKFQKPAG
jgi:hypothetical protein